VQFLTTGEAAKICGVKVNTIKRWIKSGLIAGIQTPGGHWRIPGDEFDRFLQGYGLERSQQDEPSRILIIDDDPLMHEFINHAVEAAAIGATVENAYDGYSGLLQIGHIKPHLLVLDIMLPEINGLEIISRLRAQEALGRDMRILALTGARDRKHITRSLQEAKLDAVLFKPVGMSDLIATVRRLLDHDDKHQTKSVVKR